MAKLLPYITRCKKKTISTAAILVIRGVKRIGLQISKRNREWETKNMHGKTENVDDARKPEPYNSSKRNGTMRRVADGWQNFSQILSARWRGNLERSTTIWHKFYLETVIFVSICSRWDRWHNQIASLVMHRLMIRNTLSFIVTDGDWKKGILKS